jgi:hypothetical protein
MGSAAARSSRPTITADDARSVRSAATHAGSREGAAALLRGVATAIEDEVESSVDALTCESLVFLLADVFDCIDVLDGTTVPPVE